ncbi:TPA: hypothetical protein ACK087_002776 [Staphylococcus aureus]
MLTLIKLKEDEQVIDFSLSEIENEEYFMLYRNKSFSVVRDFIEKQEFPENYKIAWY